jgi:hypothetical protein
MNGSMTVDSNVLATIVANVTSDKGQIENISSKLSSGFTALTEAGLFENCLKSLQDEAKNIITTYEVLAKELNSHVDEYTNLENAMGNIADNYQSYYSPYSGQGGNNVDGNPYDTPTPPDGTQVDPQKMDDKIPSIDDTTLSSILNFISIVKSNNLTLAELLFDPKNAEYLCTLLQNFYSTYGTLLVEYDDASKVQKEFLKKILNSNNTVPAALTTNSILKYKTYLDKISKKNNITTYEMFTDDKYKDIVKKELLNIYNNKDVDNKQFDEKFVIEFKIFMDAKAKEKNKTVEELLGDAASLI